jgi:Ca-activated chloride channel family protein
MMTFFHTAKLGFLQPQWFWLLPALWLGSLLLRRIGAHAESASLATADARQNFIHPLMRLMPKKYDHSKLSSGRIICYGLIITCLTISLAQPVRLGERLPDPPQERDIVFIVDTSISMTLRDYVLNGERIDRMTLLKGILDRFVQQLPGERIGIIVFGEAAYTLVPLTRDQSLLRRMLTRLQATMAGRYNAIGEGIALAVQQAESPSPTPRHRVLVLLTDADRPTGAIQPETAAELARQAKLPLYTVAIGASSMAAEEQRVTGLLYEPVDLSLLQHMAQRTGARSYQAGDAQALEQAIHDIARHESNKGEVTPRHYHQPLYVWPLLVALALLALAGSGLPDTLLVTKRPAVPRPQDSPVTDDE